MSPLSFEQVTTILSLLFVLTTILLTVRRDTCADRDRDRESAADQQAMMSKLDGISEMSKETRDTVREMSRQLSDHRETLAHHSEKIAALESRVSAIEQRCDRHFGDAPKSKE